MSDVRRRRTTAPKTPETERRAATASAPAAPVTPAAPSRHARGRAAEDAAAECLRANGFRLLWRNLRIGPLELDLVALKGDLAVVVEVRTRGAGSFEKPLASITRAKRKTLLRAVSALWKGRLSKMPDVARVRIDVAAVTEGADGATQVEWIAGAMTADDV